MLLPTTSTVGREAPVRGVGAEQAAVRVLRGDVGAVLDLRRDDRDVAGDRLDQPDLQGALGLGQPDAALRQGGEVAGRQLAGVRLQRVAVGADRAAGDELDVTGLDLREVAVEPVEDRAVALEADLPAAEYTVSSSRSPAEPLARRL